MTSGAGKELVIDAKKRYLVVLYNGFIEHYSTEAAFYHFCCPFYLMEVSKYIGSIWLWSTSMNDMALMIALILQTWK
jgi:hypothetical protein